MIAEPTLYSELASWWPLVSPPEDYAAEAAWYREILSSACHPAPRTLLELGAGGGNNASHLARWFELTLVDRSEAMLRVSRALNPGALHVLGDMREVRLGRRFDAVLIHDAIMYLTEADDLRRALVTARAHLRPGGAALFTPDFVRETFRDSTDCGGRDGPGRALRFVEWISDPDPDDTTYTVDYAFLLRDGDGVRVAADRHVLGLFGRADWLRLLGEAGFAAEPLQVPRETGEAAVREVFLGRVPRQR